MLWFIGVSCIGLVENNMKTAMLHSFKLPVFKGAL